jgi:hypothetical protein
MTVKRGEEQDTRKRPAGLVRRFLDWIAKGQARGGLCKS